MNRSWHKKRRRGSGVGVRATAATVAGSRGAEGAKRRKGGRGRQERS